MKWTKEQEKAIYQKGSNIIVSAGAGSGKTAVLTERTIETLKTGVNIDQMIILTFTKAAAFSMKEKIKKRLRKESDPHLQKQLKLIEQASICTFDSFSLDLVKKYSDTLNIDPDINIADSVLVEALKSNIVDEVFLDFYQDEKFLNLLDTYTVKDDKSIKNDVVSIVANLDKIYDIDTFLNNYITLNFDIDKINTDISEYIGLIKNLYQEFQDKVLELNHFSLTTKEEKTLEVLNNFLNFQEYEEFKAFRLPFPRYISKEESAFKSKLSEIKEIYQNINELVTYDSITEMQEEILETKPYIEAIIDLVREIIKRTNEYKRNNNLYEFNDISRLAIKLLLENDDIRNYYKNNIKEIMIDEYQDTNDIGDFFISLIANNNVFMVGDVKQSIYRFRNANPKIFIEKYNNYANHIDGEKIDLNKNFRSRCEVIENINRLFKRLMSEEVGGANYAKDHIMYFGQEAYPNSGQNNNMEVYNYDPEDYYGFKKEEIEAFIIADDILNKINNHYQVYDFDNNSLRDIKYSDFSILLTEKREFELYKKIFDFKNIPLIIHKDEDLTYSTELIVVKNIIKLIGFYQNINLDNTLVKTYMSVARSFVCNYKDDQIFKTILESKGKNLFDYIQAELQEKIIYLSNFSKEHSISELVSEVIETFDIYLKASSIGDQKEIALKLDHLFDIASSLEKSNYGLKEFINYLLEATSEDIKFTISTEKDQNLGVNLMTIHKSKGLEFPICYFADLNKKFNSRDIKPRFLFDLKYGFIAPVFKEGIKTTIYKELLKQEFMKEEISERIRVFYVALTRAKEKMIFVTNLKEEDTNKEFIPKTTKLHFRSLNSVLNALSGSFHDDFINYPKLELTREYELVKDKIELNSNVKFDTIEIMIQKEELEDKHFSKSSVQLMNNNTLEFGTKIHECLEYLNFNDFDNSLNNLIIDEFFKNKISKIKTMPFFKEKAIYHKEYEFLTESDNIQKHGIIDLLIEDNDELIVVDYKLNDINKPYYLDQVRGYMNYLKTISSKKVKGYLYSILDENYKEVEN